LPSDIFIGGIINNNLTTKKGGNKKIMKRKIFIPMNQAEELAILVVG